ncbi:type II secretion system F family protein [Herbaspirillum sp. RTI4]|uniref:type II secretion system F family protein n=1 Tax=Herbaspirillum sp. RTI4 TaxID=3048640 RepID=UPI002AB491EC|nr:type II secretion system F family protein [Herbaspirillum sp. RTI4]MDY7577497.1 type II secretion system F family protein [Herbaspirillum sp. RTI4]MEA9980972.1 type II secretion system F family protein [Herbaspirillum sp. RTI4]
MNSSSPPSTPPRETIYQWHGRDRHGKPARGELSAHSLALAHSALRERGVLVAQLRPKRFSGRIKPKDICMLTRQLATMIKAGVPLLQSFGIVANSHTNPAVVRLLGQLGTAIESGSSLQQAFAAHPQYFDPLFCNLVGAGEQAGVLDELLARLATYQEKTLALKAKLRSVLLYPAAIVAVALIVTAVIMIVVVPAFAAVFKGFGAELPLMTQAVIALSNWVVAWWHLMLVVLCGTSWGLVRGWRRSPTLRARSDRLLLKLPILGNIVRQACAARWAHTLATMFAAGVPLAEALDAVGTAAGNAVFREASEAVQRDIIAGSSLTLAMAQTQAFPPLLTQMAAIGEESGSLDQMLGKAADMFQSEVDLAVSAAASLMEPIIMVVLGILIGALVIAMYLPIFTLGSVV